MLVNRELSRVMRNARVSRVCGKTTDQIIAKVSGAGGGGRNFFCLLTPLDEKPEHSFCELRVFEDKKMNIVVKRTSSSHGPTHGSSLENYRKFYFSYRRLLKSGEIAPEKYILAPLRAYGVFKQELRVTVGRFTSSIEWSYILMERIKEDLRYFEGHLSVSGVESLAGALGEMRSDVLKVAMKGGFERVPQHTCHVLMLGNTNRAKPEKGRWVFALPHDTEDGLY